MVSAILDSQAACLFSRAHGGHVRVQGGSRWKAAVDQVLRRAATVTQLLDETLSAVPDEVLSLPNCRDQPHLAFWEVFIRPAPAVILSGGHSWVATVGLPLPKQMTRVSCCAAGAGRSTQGHQCTAQQCSDGARVAATDVRLHTTSSVSSGSARAGRRQQPDSLRQRHCIAAVADSVRLRSSQ